MQSAIIKMQYVIHNLHLLHSCSFKVRQSYPRAEVFLEMLWKNIYYIWKYYFPNSLSYPVWYVKPSRCKISSDIENLCLGNDWCIETLSILLVILNQALLSLAHNPLLIMQLIIVEVQIYVLNGELKFSRVLGFSNFCVILNTKYGTKLHICEISLTCLSK